MITTIVIKGENWNNLKHAYFFFKSTVAVVKYFSNGYLLIFENRLQAQQCLNEARKKMTEEGCDFIYKRFKKIELNECTAEIVK